MSEANNVVKFPFERTKKFKEKIKDLDKATDWWTAEGHLSEAERRRELHRIALGYAPPQANT